MGVLHAIVHVVVADGFETVVAGEREDQLDVAEDGGLSRSRDRKPRTETDAEDGDLLARRIRAPA